MALISCDMRQSRTDEQKRKLTAGLLRVISEATVSCLIFANPKPRATSI
jgi:hypothetical protein